MDTVQQQGHPLHRILHLFIKYGVIANLQCDICTALEYVFEYTGFKKYCLPLSLTEAV